MAIKKTQLYSMLWESANELRGGMDASSYKDYVLVILFVKYVTDKYRNDKYASFIVPEGGSFFDMIETKGKTDIGEKINKIIGKLAEANDLKGVIDKTDFDDSEKLGKGQEKVDRLTKLIAIFENPNLDFSKNKAGGDDILGDVYEYFMKHFASESGKSKGQFYTPAEVSRIMAKIIGVEKATSADQTAYDMACGSGSLLLKVASESSADITLYGQEKDIAVSVLAKMNMILHGKPTAEIKNGNTLTDPKFKDGDRLKIFDFCVANPPFSDKSWMTGLDPENDEYHRFDDGIPPAKNGDYAFLLHFIKSLKHTGKGAIILPHGVLFRGNAEADIRKNLIKKGYFKGIIGLPANLFFGTGIPAVIIVIDKENAQNRKGIFMIDASKGFIKDGNKNRLRERDIHKIVDIFTNQKEEDKYSRMVSLSEIEKNEYNLNLPRYIDTSEEEDIQDIYAHLNGGIPNVDIGKMKEFWEEFPTLKKNLFDKKNDKYSLIKVGDEKITDIIFKNNEFQSFRQKVKDVFQKWREDNIEKLQSIDEETNAKEFIKELSNNLLNTFKPLNLLDEYAVYQYLMDYWDETMQDDVYIIIDDGWKANTYRILEKNKKGKEIDKGWTCDILPKFIVIDEYFKDEKKEIEDLESKRDEVVRQMEEMQEENSGDEGLLEDAKTEKGTLTKASVSKRIKETTDSEEKELLQKYLKLIESEADYKKQIKAKEKELDDKLLEKYPTLTEEDVKDLVVNKKWLKYLEDSINDEQEKILQSLSQRIKELAKRYENKLSEIEEDVEVYEKKVKEHLEKMGFKI